MKKKQAAAVFFCAFFLQTGTLPAGAAELQPAAASAAAVSQIQGDFPDPAEAGMEYALNRRKFKGYKGRGTIILTNHGAKAAAVFVNGRRIPYQPSAAEQAPVRIDIGAYTQDGDNTLKVLNLSPADARLEVTIPYPEVTEGTPAQAGFREAKLARVDEVLRNDVKNGFPGAVLLVLKNGRIVKETAYGWAQLYDRFTLLPESQRSPMTVHTMFDLASNTKMYATILALMKLTDEGLVDPEAPVARYLPDYTGDGRENVLVRDVMTHSAGYAPDVFFHQPARAGDLYSCQRERTLQLLNQVPFVYPTGSKTVYSDTDYMLLTALIERVTGQRLDTYVEQNIYQPLGLRHTLFNPLRKGFLPREFAATEDCGNTRGGQVSFPGVRTATIRGEVQDEQAYYSMDGVSGHAGLFSQARDLAVLAQLLLNRGGYGSYYLCSPQVFDAYTKPTDRNPGMGLGWNKMTGAKRVWEFGPYASSEAIAHSGWTGTDICIDPRYDLAIILLTNRVHAPAVPGRNAFAADDMAADSYGSILSLVYEAFLE